MPIARALARQSMDATGERMCIRGGLLTEFEVTSQVPVARSLPLPSNTGAHVGGANEILHAASVLMSSSSGVPADRVCRESLFQKKIEERL